MASGSYGKIVQYITLAFLFNGIGTSLAATGHIHPVWAMVAMAVSVTAIFFNSLWGSAVVLRRDPQRRSPNRPHIAAGDLSKGTE